MEGEWIDLTDADDRWYMDASYPSMVAHYLYKLGLIHGHAKIQYTLLSMVSVFPSASSLSLLIELLREANKTVTDV